VTLDAAALEEMFDNSMEALEADRNSLWEEREVLRAQVERLGGVP